MTSASDQHRSRLERTRSATTLRIANLTQTFDDIVLAAVDVATDDEHDPEGHTIAWERQQVAALLDEAKATLAELGEAEARLEAGTYGACVTCGLGIAPARLDLLPATSTCVSCVSPLRSGRRSPDTE